jgi:hypothetical protein
MFVSPVWHSLRIYHSDAAVVERTSATITLSMPEVRNGNLDFSGKPGRFDIDGYLAFAPERITWLFNQSRKDFSPAIKFFFGVPVGAGHLVPLASSQSVWSIRKAAALMAIPLNPLALGPETLCQRSHARFQAQKRSSSSRRRRTDQAPEQ